MRTVFILMMAFCLAVMQLFGQSVVINEYRNESQAGNEWTELLVIQDNSDIRGWTLRDYAGSTPPPTQLIGGVRFKDNPLWSNLRAGTIIVINHRNCNSPDLVKEDGYIELGAFDTAYLDTVLCPGCSDWAIKAMSIAANSDMIELVDQNGNAIHCLAHTPINGGAFAALTSPKAAFYASISSGQSIAILPGSDISSYSCGYDSGYSNTDTTYLLTKGKPNNSSRRMNLNQAFWRSTRQPVWDSPGFTNSTIDKDKVFLEWNSCTDPNPADGSTGYLLIRYESKDSVAISSPVDGKIYNVGDYISKGIIIYSGQDKKFTDTYSIKCGESYIYIAYAWRFSKDDKNEDGSPMNARGRSYNEGNFAKITISKPDIINPVIDGNNGVLKYCQGDSIVLRCINEKYDSYEWLKDNIPTGIVRDSIVVEQSGIYRLRVSGTYGCIKLSNELDIREISPPLPRLTVESPMKVVLSADTTLSVCTGENIQFRITGAEAFKWFRDDAEIPDAKGQLFIPAQSGVYHAEAVNGGICSVISYKITLKIRDINIRSDNDNLDFTITSGAGYMDKQLVVENLSNEDILVDPANVNINSDFSIISPALPWMLTSGQKLTITLRYTPVQPKTVNGQLTINLPCNEVVRINLSGTKLSTGLVSEVSSVNFDGLNVCSAFPKDTSIQITNNSNFALNILETIITPPFYVKGPVFPFDLAIGASENIEFGITQSSAGQYTGMLRIAYQTTDFHPTIHDTLDIALNAKVSDVDYSCAPQGLNIGFSNCDVTKDTLIEIINDGETDISVFRNNNIPIIKLLNLPLDVKAGDRAFLRIRLEPSSSSDLGITYNQELRSSPCGLIRDFAVNLIDNNFDITFSKDTFDFGYAGYCGEAIELNDSAQISISGSPSEKIVIKDITYTGNISPIISTNLAPGMELKEADMAYFDLNLPAVGNYEGDMNLTFTPCDIRKVIHFKASASIPEYNLSSTAIDFNTVPINEVARDTLRFYNSGMVVIKVLELRGISSPFLLDVKPSLFPAFVEPDSVLDIPLMFSPLSPGIYSQSGSLIVEEPCPGSIDFTLNGKAESSVNDPIKGIAFAPQLKARPGEVINIPIRLALEPPTEINSIGVAAIELMISYNRKLFNFESVKPGAAFGTPPNAYVTPQENYPGNMSFLIDQIDPAQIRDGEILVISGTALIGDTVSTPIIIDTVIIYSNEITTIQTVDGLLTIDGDCSQEGRNVTVGGQLSLSIKNELRRDEPADISYHLISDDYSTLKLYDMNGNLVTALADGLVGRGDHTSQLQTAELSQGIYLLILRNGFLQKSVRILILD